MRAHKTGMFQRKQSVDGGWRTLSCWGVRGAGAIAKKALLFCQGVSGKVV